MTEQLKPCPFCGSEPHDAHHIEYGRWAVTCNCGVMGACANTGPNASDAAKIKAYNDARHAWNTRALTTSQPAAQATPEPVGEVYGWAVTGLSFIWRGEHAQACAEQEAKTCGGTSMAFPLFTHPAPGVPESDPLQGAVDWFWQAIPDLQPSDVAGRLSIGYNRAARLVAAAQAKGS